MRTPACDTRAALALALAIAAAGCAAHARPPAACPAYPGTDAATSATTGAIVVRVMRRSGTIVPGAAVLVRRGTMVDSEDVLDSHGRLEARTDVCGVAIVTSLAPGQYHVDVDATDGFRSQAFNNVSAGRVTTVTATVSRRPLYVYRPSDYGALVGGLALLPRSDVPRAYGVAIEGALLPLVSIEDCDDGACTSTIGPYLGVSGLAAVTDGAPDRTRRGLYGLRLSAGLGWGRSVRFVPYATVGLDALVVTTTLPSGSDNAGLTLGADVRVGVLGQLGTRLLYQVGASYLGAVAPGVGDNAGGLVLQASLGWRFQTRVAGDW